MSDLLAVEFRAIMTNFHAAGPNDYNLRTRRFQHLVKQSIADAGIELAFDHNGGTPAWWISDVHMEVHTLRRRDEQLLTEMYSVTTCLGVFRTGDTARMTSTIEQMPLGAEFPYSGYRFVDVPGQKSA